MINLVGKDVKTITITRFYVFKNIKERQNISRRGMGNM